MKKIIIFLFFTQLSTVYAEKSLSLESINFNTKKILAESLRSFHINRKGSLESLELKSGEIIYREEIDQLTVNLENISFNLPAEMIDHIKLDKLALPKEIHFKKIDGDGSGGG